MIFLAKDIPKLKEKSRIIIRRKGDPDLIRFNISIELNYLADAEGVILKYKELTKCN